MLRILIGASLLVSTSVFADDVVTTRVPEGDGYFAILPGEMFPDKSRGGTRHGFTTSGVLGYQLSPHFATELNLQGSIIETGHDRGTDFYQEGGTVDLVASLFDPRISWTPYVLAGPGASYDDVYPSSGKKGTFIADAGLGIKSGGLFGTNVKLRLEGRYNHDFYHEFRSAGYNDYRALAGIEIPFGSSVVRTPSVRVVEAPARVVAAPPQVVQVPRPWVDSDGDGVDDEHDKCPNTPHGLKVDSEGCVIVGQILELRGVTFEFNKATLQINAQTVLDYVIKGMQGQPTMKVEIGGHTDSIGSASYNLGLSQRRAEAVRDYLVEQGIDPARLTAVGYGKTQPKISPELSADDRERNRRVEFKVLEK